MGQLTFQQGRHHLQSRFAEHLVRFCETRMSTPALDSATPNLFQLRLPCVQSGLDCAVSLHDGLHELVGKL
jgi:hypothetical protein